MSKEEARSRWEDLHNHVTTQTAQSFITTFLNRTLRSNISHIASLSAAGDPDSVPVFNLARMLPRYKHSMKRLILVDFEGTLWRRDLSKDGMQCRMLRKEEEWSEEDEAWPKDSVELLKTLADDKKNEVWVLSGLVRTGILGKLSKVAPKVGIIAENGCFIKTRSTRGQEGQWISMVSQFNMTWKSACMEILHYVGPPPSVLLYYVTNSSSRSSPNEHPILSSRNARPPSFGASGAAMPKPTRTTLTANGPAAKLPKLRTTSSTLSGSASVCVSFLAKTPSLSSPTTFRVQLPSPPFCTLAALLVRPLLGVPPG
jgi:hypothetical protein